MKDADFARIHVGPVSHVKQMLLALVLGESKLQVCPYVCPVMQTFAQAESTDHLPIGLS